MTLSYLHTHHICRSNFIYRRNVSFNIFKTKKGVPHTILPLFLSQKSNLQTNETPHIRWLSKMVWKSQCIQFNLIHNSLKDSLNDRMNDFLLALPLSTLLFAQYTLTWPCQSQVVLNKQYKNSLDNTCSGHAAEIVRGYSIFPWQVLSKLSNLVNLEVYATFSFIHARIYSVV